MFNKLALESKPLHGIFLKFNGSRDMNNKQLVTEMTQRVAAISSAKAENNVIPRFNQQHIIACFNTAFRVHDNIPKLLKLGLFSDSRTISIE